MENSGFSQYKLLTFLCALLCPFIVPPLGLNDALVIASHVFVLFGKATKCTFVVTSPDTSSNPHSQPRSPSSAEFLLIAIWMSLGDDPNIINQLFMDGLRLFFLFLFFLDREWIVLVSVGPFVIYALRRKKKSFFPILRKTSTFGRVITTTWKIIRSMGTLVMSQRAV